MAWENWGLTPFGAGPQNRRAGCPALALLFSLRLRHSRARRLSRCLLALLQLVEEAAALTTQRGRGRARRRRGARCAAAALQDGARIAMHASQDREYEARREEGGREICGGAGEHIGSAPARHEARARARRKPAAFRFLQE